MANMNTPLDPRGEYDTPYNSVDAAEWQNPDGSRGFKNANVASRNIKTCGTAVQSAPYGLTDAGKQVVFNHIPEVVVNMSKEFVLVFIKTLLVVGIASHPAGPDPVSRAIYLGLLQGIAVFVGLSLGNNSLLPRHGNFGVTVAELMAGRLSWYFALLYPGMGFLAALASGAVLERTGASAIPVVGVPNVTSVAGAWAIEFVVGVFIIWVVLDQFSARRGGARNHGKRANIGSTNESVGARPLVYAGMTAAATSFAFLKWGIFTGSDTYTYFAGAFGQQLLGVVNPWGQAAEAVPLSGAWALFIFTPALCGFVAFGIDAIFYYGHSNGGTPSANYGGKRTKRPRKTKTQSSKGSNFKQATEAVERTRNAAPPLTSEGW